MMPLVGAVSSSHSTPRHAAGVPPKRPVLATHGRVLSPEYLSYPVAQVYVAVDGKRLPLEYETVPWDGASTALHSRPIQDGVATSHVLSTRHAAEVVVGDSW